MQLDTLSVPDSIRESTDFVTAHATHVHIDTTALTPLAARIRGRLEQGTDDLLTAFGTTGDLARDCNVICFETACNFYFWSESPDSKWRVLRGGTPVGGWYGLAACFQNAIDRHVPVDDAAWMAQLSIETARDLFAGTGTPLPLLEQRVNNIVEFATYLQKNYDGQALKFLEAQGFSAPKIAEAVTCDLASFRDGAWYKGRWVWLLKRAQILASDLAQLSSVYPEFVIQDTEQLTAFADYRLPQLLRHYNVFTYSADFSRLVDHQRIVPAGSEAEIEVRAATIGACDLLAAELPGYTSAQVDLGLWLLSQDMRGQAGLKPHHHTPGYFY